MAYDISKYKIQPGDIVKIKEGRAAGTHERDGVVIASWDFTKSRIGYVVEVTNYGKRGNSPPWIIVEPADPEAGFGRFTFQSKDLEIQPEDHQRMRTDGAPELPGME